MAARLETGCVRPLQLQNVSRADVVSSNGPKAAARVEE